WPCGLHGKIESSSNASASTDSWRGSTACAPVSRRAAPGTPSSSVSSKRADPRRTEMRLPWDVKTRYLYKMSSRLVNVRLDEERVRKAQTLREHGVALSDVVREAIDERFAALRQSESPPD